MGKDRRLSPNQLAELKSGFAGLKSVVGYAPINDEFSVASIEPIETAGDNLRIQEAQLAAQLAEVRDRIAANDTEFARLIKSARHQIVAQFGDDSPEYQALGRKRVSDRKPGRRAGASLKKPQS